MTPIVLLILSVFAAARLTRAIVDDKITEPIRVGISQRLRQPEFDDDGMQVRSGSKITYLVFCVWCTGFWVGFLVAALAWFGALHQHIDAPWWVAVPLLGLTLGQTTGLLKIHFDSE